MNNIHEYNNIAILCVDDQPEVISQFFFVVKLSGLKRGLKIEEDYASSGKIAHIKTRHNSYDLIILDYELPDIDGPDLCRELRAEGIQTPILMFSAASDPYRRIVASEAGVDYFLHKVVGIDKFLDQIQALLRRKQ